MNLMKSMKIAAVAAALFSASVAHAALYEFKLTGDYTASWQLDSTPDIPVARVDIFVIDAVNGNFPGTVSNSVNLTFFNSTLYGGLQINDSVNFMQLMAGLGDQLYTGPEANPTFRLGTFELRGSSIRDAYTLTVTELEAMPEPAPVPEPASAALLLGGLGLLHAARKRRQQK